MDVLIRITLIGALALLCYRIFSPFLTLTVWSIILAVTLYPFHQWLARGVKKQWLASTIVIVIGLVVIIVPVAWLVNSFADSTRGFIHAVQQNTLQIPPPRAGIESWPLVGRKIYAGWSSAHSDLPGFVQGMQPKIGDLAQRALAMVASLGKGLLLFVASFIVAGILMAYGKGAAGAGRGIFVRVAGASRGEALFKLTTSTIRAVASGIIGIAFIQALLTGVALMIAGVPAPGILAIIVLVLAIAQLPAVIVTIPAIIWIWSSGQYSATAAIVHTIILLVVGLADNVLKPLMLGRGVEVPMPIMLLGALGGMATGGILGMFVGATLFALGHQLFMGWLKETPDSEPEAVSTEPAEMAQAAAKT
jgi:predicted PurR-regulated permease PerM